MAKATFFPIRPREFIFTNVASVTIDHNLGYIPEVQVHLQDGTLVQGDVRHITVNRVVVTFANAISGSVYIR